MTYGRFRFEFVRCDTHLFESLGEFLLVDATVAGYHSLTPFVYVEPAYCGVCVCVCVYVSRREIITFAYELLEFASYNLVCT